MDTNKSLLNVSTALEAMYSELRLAMTFNTQPKNAILTIKAPFKYNGINESPLFKAGICVSIIYAIKKGIIKSANAAIDFKSSAKNSLILYGFNKLKMNVIVVNFLELCYDIFAAPIV